jgi:hypothetical protein
VYLYFSHASDNECMLPTNILTSTFHRETLQTTYRAVISILFIVNFDYSCIDRLSVSTTSRSRTLYSRGVPKYKPDKFGRVRSELGPDVVGGE